jgi:hypothetical protein
MFLTEGAEMHSLEKINTAQPKVINTPGLQWLVLPDEDTASYTNWGDGRPGDASELVAKVNADPALGAGFTDWRMPTKKELKRHIGNEAAPKEGWFWSSSPYVGNSSAWFVNFYGGYVYLSNRNDNYQVRLVRVSQ